MCLSYTIEAMTAEDWEQVRAIYLEGIATGNATFEQEAPSWEQWDAGHLPEGRLVARTPAAILGWAALSRVSGRCVYAGVAEVSIYIGLTGRGQGIGSALLGRLIQESEQHGLWTLQVGIFPENSASLALHKRQGFREIGRRERIGKMQNVWRDVLLLERRSSIVGINEAEQ